MGKAAAGSALVCAKCGRSYDEIVLVCPSCGWLTVFDYSGGAFRVDREGPGIWRYRSLLPKLERMVSRGEGLTPINIIGGVPVKNERYNPTGSYSDRASSVIASYVLSKGVGAVRTRFEEDFTRSLAYYLSGSSFVEVVVDDPLAPDYLDIDFLLRAKNVHLVSEGGTAGHVFFGYANPFTVEGLKTIAFEIYERGLKVDRVVVPARTGLLAYSIWKGFKDLEKAGIDVTYEVVAASIKGSNGPPMLNLATSVKVVEISGEEVLSSLLKLWRSGVRTKPLSASAYTVAESLGSSVAVVTMGFRPPSTGRRGNREIRREIVRLLESRGEATAYEVWKVFPLYSLRGMYKALKTMEERGEVCGEYRSKGKRKVKYYRTC